MKSAFGESYRCVVCKQLYSRNPSKPTTLIEYVDGDRKGVRGPYCPTCKDMKYRRAGFNEEIYSDTLNRVVEFHRRRSHEHI